MTEAAVAIADRSGLDALTIRALAAELDVKPMSIYHHVANKSALLDTLVEFVFGAMERPRIGGPWRAELTRRAQSARAVLRQHPWAIGLIESRPNPGPELLAHHNAVIGTLRSAGFSVSATAHAFAVLDAFVYGFALQEATLPFDTAEEVAPLAEAVLEALPADDYPWFVELAREHVLQPGYDFAAEFEIGLGIVLDGIGRLRRGSSTNRP